MQISSKTKSEDLRVQYFVKDGPTIAVSEIEINIPIGTSAFAVAAMMKGLQEFYFAPAGMKVDDPEQTKVTEHNLALWVEAQTKKKEEPSRLILP
jgi:hypothetical protein